MLEKILVLEDDRSNLEILKIMFESENYEVMGIADAALLQKSLNDFRPDLLVMDIDLGDTDGRRLANDLKTSIAYNSLPIVLVTALGYGEIAKIECDADAILAKPLDVDSMVLAVHTLLYNNVLI